MNPESWSQFRNPSGGPTDPSLTSCALLPPSTAAPVGVDGAVAATAGDTSTTNLLQSVPPESSSADMTERQLQQESTMNCVPTAEAPASSEPAHIPRRNLSEAFEELYIAAPMDSANCDTTGTPGTKPSNASDAQLAASNLISPTGVADLHAMPNNGASSASKEVLPSNRTKQENDEGASHAKIPFFHLHDDLKRDLSQAVINRVSFYAIIHDINKEATAMAANDDAALSRATPAEDVSEENSPLVQAVKGPNENKHEIDSNMMQTALIDEEKWLLSAIETRGVDESRTLQACPPTFLQAMGEREYENPLNSLSSGSRTQLWKPSRSWWEAKSGKNPWIEPKSHNKRWRYLWPLIHYHKFLAKCIKKLKRNGVDVKLSVSPVAAFLREEVCAVSDHLASVSLFDSDEWMNCLRYFSGWVETSPKSDAMQRLLVSKLPLRPLAEYGDLESPLLRSQIDEHYLRAMAASRSQMEVGSEPELQKHSNGKTLAARHPNSQPRHTHCQQYTESLPPHLQPVPNHVGGGLRRHRLGYPHPFQWWNQAWHQTQYQQHPHSDDISVHSSLSGEAAAFPEYGMYPGPNGHFYPPMFHPHHVHSMEHSHYPTGFDHGTPEEAGMYPAHSPYHPDHMGLGFYGHPSVDPSIAYQMHQHDEIGNYYAMPPEPNSPQDSPSAQHNKKGVSDGTNKSEKTDSFQQQTPYKYDPSKTPRSPYWGHLDTTIAMGLSTPQTQTKGGSGNFVSPEEGGDGGAVGTAAQPLLLRQSQFYGYGPVSNYGPPSPATQFLMSPQANFAMNYGYGYSPSHGGHLSSHLKQSARGGLGKDGSKRASALKQAAPGLSHSGNGLGRKPAADGDERESPSTVDTITESESLSEAT